MQVDTIITELLNRKIGQLHVHEIRKSFLNEKKEKHK